MGSISAMDLEEVPLLREWELSQVESAELLCPSSLVISPDIALVVRGYSDYSPANTELVLLSSKGLHLRTYKGMNVTDGAGGVF